MIYLIQENGLLEEEAGALTDEIIANLDQNHDGSISLEEFADGYVEIIKKLR
jgi:Ca2+-binding EF-hand superfamily protein